MFKIIELTIILVLLAIFIKVVKKEINYGKRKSK